MSASDDPVLAAFGEFVRAQRQLAHVSLRNLAKMSGVSDSYLSQIERGNYRPSPQVVKALATAFGLKPEQLYTMLGFMDETDSSAPLSVEQAIQMDPRLQPSQKEALVRVPILRRRRVESAPMAADKTDEFQQQALEMLRAQQEAVAAVKAWREAIASGESSVPPPSPEPTPLHMLPTPTEMAEAYYAFAAKLLAEQSRFMDALSQAMAPPKKKP